MLQALEILVNNSKNSVFVVSGRDQAFLDQHLGYIQGLGLSAEHGMTFLYLYFKLCDRMLYKISIF